jgi:hypothetical protein
MSDSTVSRRDFVQKAVLFTGAGLAVGGAAAIGKSVWDSNQSSATELESLQSQVADSSVQIAQLQQALSLAETELNKLRPDYAALLSVNAQLQNTLTSQQQEVDTAKADLIAAQLKLEKLSKLVAMYEQLDNNSFDTLVQSGLNSAAAGFAGALGLLPLVTEGLKAAAGLLDGFEFQIPNYRSGLSWLQKRMDDMTSSISSVEKAIVQALKTLDPVTSTMTQLMNYILTWLPTNIGAGVKAALDAIDFLYASLPPVITGAHDQVIEMLTAPFADDEQGLKRTMVKPIREKALAPSEKLTQQVQSLNDTYTQSLHVPVQVALDQRSTLLKQIADFKAANQM